ncbi:jg7043 [Pararge aegeria aegeria]|uniref:Jg7043 protein n=1 Tax=Pararge aegeria aegeria TaxID=348720 RepID=A0A8S4RK89_9NEOP|nr:jg7043 [Pararge aegeria aegeria]
MYGNQQHSIKLCVRKRREMYGVRKIKEQKKYKDGNRMQKAALSLSSDLCQATFGLGQDNRDDDEDFMGGIEFDPSGSN